jgi:hypothetical protein
MTEYRLFDQENPPDWLDPEWWRDKPHCNHLESPTGAHVARLHAAAELADSAAQWFNGRVTDLGAGDGALLSLLSPEVRDQSWGYEIIRADRDYARQVRGVEVHWRNARVGLETGGIVLAPVVVLTEVLEHMADPHGFLALLRDRPEVKRIVASSPWGETPDKHEPNHAWAWDTLGYGEMFNNAGWVAATLDKIEWSQVWVFGRRQPPERGMKFAPIVELTP